LAQLEIIVLIVVVKSIKIVLKLLYKILIISPCICL